MSIGLAKRLKTDIYILNRKAYIKYKQKQHE
jgi:hypothetical protein